MSILGLGLRVQGVRVCLYWYGMVAFLYVVYFSVERWFKCDLAVHVYQFMVAVLVSCLRLFGLHI